MARPRDLVTSSEITVYFAVVHRVEVKPATVRQWASRGRIGTHGSGRGRYSLREVVAFAKENGLV